MKSTATLRAVVCTLILAAVPAGLAAQDLKADLLADFERQRANVLAYVDAMPASGLRSAPTEGVRDFAQQIEHVALGNVNIVESGLDADRIDLGLDRDAYLADKVELARMVNVAFDRVRDVIGAMSQADLMATGTLFGQVPDVPRWKIARTAYEHGVWTLGATVPYLRLQGATPPGYDLVPAGGMQ